MKRHLLVVFLAGTLTACGSVPVSDSDKLAFRSGEKALLVTTNRQLSDYLFIIPIFLDAAFGAPDALYVERIDGKTIQREWKRVNQKIVLTPGQHTIVASCSVTITDMNRDVDDSSGEDVQWTTDVINYTFEGGTKYRIYSQEHLNGTCSVGIELD